MYSNSEYSLTTIMHILQIHDYANLQAAISQVIAM